MIGWFPVSSNKVEIEGRSLLGGWYNERKDGPQAQWKSDAKLIKAMINFVTATGRLQMEAHG